MRFLFIITLFSLSMFAQQKEYVRVQLAWKYQFQSAGYIMAKELGFYERAGLHVNLKEYDNSKLNILEEVLSGRADFGVGRSSLLSQWLENSYDIKLLFATFQSSPLVLLAKQREDIQRLEDIKGKNLMPLGDLGYDDNMLPILAMLASKGVSKRDFNLLKPSFDILDMCSEKTDLLVGYISNEPFAFQEMGIKTQIFNPNDYGFDFYSDFLFTSGKLEKQKPDVVAKFREATLDGWKYALNHPNETVDILYNSYNTQDKTREALMHEAEVLSNLAQKPNIPFGHIDPVVLRSMFNAMHLLKLIHSPIRGFDELIYKPMPKKGIKLSPKEMQYIYNNPKVKLGVDVGWRPFSYMDKQGEYKGLASDYIKEISKFSGLEFEIEFGTWSDIYNRFKNEDIDIVANMFFSDERAELFNFSRPYFEVREYAFTREGVPAEAISSMFGKRVAIQKDYETANRLRQLYGSQVDFIEYATVDEAINALLTYKVDFLYNTTAVVQEILKNRAITNVKPAFQIFEKGRFLHFATQKEDTILANIISKALDNIPEDRLQSIASKWINIHEEEKFDYDSFWRYAIVALIIVFAIVYKNILLSRVNKSLQEKERLLEEQVKYNEKLLEENKRFIADTVHQIRTPLSVIMANSNMIDMHFNNEEISEYVSLINGSINLLSNTYEDLAYMVSSGNVEYTPSELNLSMILQRRVDFFNTILHVEKRQIISHIDEDIYFRINDIEFERLIDNNLTNALKYGYDENDIYVTLLRLDEQINFSVKTRSKMILDKERVFTKNYRENDANRGLGLGLSITKGICDKYGITYHIKSAKDLNIFTYTFYNT